VQLRSVIHNQLVHPSAALAERRYIILRCKVLAVEFRRMKAGDHHGTAGLLADNA
jgi:hypothetical protein